MVLTAYFLLHFSLLPQEVIEVTNVFIFLLISFSIIMEGKKTNTILDMRKLRSSIVYVYILCKHMLYVRLMKNNDYGRIKICYTIMPGQETLGRDIFIVQ